MKQAVRTRRPATSGTATPAAAFSSSADDPRGEGDGRLPLPDGLPRREATALARRYRAGESIVALAASTGLAAKRVSAALRSVGVVPTIGRMTLLPRRVLVDGYLRRGLSANALAAELGCSSQKVRDDLRRHGLTLRPQAQTAPGLDTLGNDGLRRLYFQERLASARDERDGDARRGLLVVG